MILNGTCFANDRYLAEPHKTLDGFDVVTGEELSRKVLYLGTGGVRLAPCMGIVVQVGVPNIMTAYKYRIDRVAIINEEVELDSSSY